MIDVKSCDRFCNLVGVILNFYWSFFLDQSKSRITPTTKQNRTHDLTSFTAFSRLSRHPPVIGYRRRDLTRKCLKYFLSSVSDVIFVTALCRFLFQVLLKMAKNLIALESVVLQLNSNWALAKSSRGGTKEWLAPRSFEVGNLKNKHSRGDF